MSWAERAALATLLALLVLVFAWLLETDSRRQEANRECEARGMVVIEGEYHGLYPEYFCAEVERP